MLKTRIFRELLMIPSGKKGSTTVGLISASQQFVVRCKFRRHLIFIYIYRVHGAFVVKTGRSLTINFELDQARLGHH